MHFPAITTSGMKHLLTLILGFALGFSFSQLMNLSYFTCYDTNTQSLRLWNRTRGPSYGILLGDEHNPHYEYDEESLSSPNVLPTALENSAAAAAAAEKHFNESHANMNASLANYLYNETRILCWVLTGPKNHDKRALHVKRTWGSRCNKLIFMSSLANSTLGAVKLPVKEGRGQLWKKTREAFKYIYDHHLDDADWFLKADDDTYVIPENLRAFLYPYSTDAPVYFGCKFKPHVRQGYMSGGAGYVLSKEALKRFVEHAYPNSTICRQRDGGSEDIELGSCLQNVGVVAGDSRDEQKRGRFFPTSPQGHIIPKIKSSWYWRYIYYATTDGLNCCSDYAISFHYIRPDQFYLMDYFIYHLRPFGILQERNLLPPKQNMTELLDKWRNETSDNPL